MWWSIPLTCGFKRGAEKSLVKLCLGPLFVNGVVGVTLAPSKIVSYLSVTFQEQCKHGWDVPFPANEENCHSNVLGVHSAVALSLVLVALTWDEKKKKPHQAHFSFKCCMLHLAIQMTKSDKKHFETRIHGLVYKKKKWCCLQSPCALVPYCLRYIRL